MDYRCIQRHWQISSHRTSRAQCQTLYLSATRCRIEPSQRTMSFEIEKVTIEWYSRVANGHARTESARGTFPYNSYAFWSAGRVGKQCWSFTACPIQGHCTQSWPGNIRLGCVQYHQFVTNLCESCRENKWKGTYCDNIQLGGFDYCSRVCIVYGSKARTSRNFILRPN